MHLYIYFIVYIYKNTSMFLIRLLFKLFIWGFLAHSLQYVGC